jgi:hypothetical protein
VQFPKDRSATEYLAQLFNLKFLHRRLIGNLGAIVGNQELANYG